MKCKRCPQEPRVWQKIIYTEIKLSYYNAKPYYKIEPELDISDIPKLDVSEPDSIC